MSNFLEDIVNTMMSDCNGEKIESIVIASFHSYYEEDNKGIPTELINKPVAWEDVKKYLDYEYDTGYGGADCHAIYAYTKSHIIYVSEYDGATSVEAMPRHPIECTPTHI